MIIVIVTVEAHCKGPIKPFPEAKFYACKPEAIQDSLSES